MSTATKTIRDRNTVTGRVRSARDQHPGVDMEFCVSTELVASDGLKIAREAWTPYLAGGERNAQFPPMCAGHKTIGPAGELTVIAKPVRESVRWIEGEGLVVGVLFADATVNPQAPRYRKAYEDGFLTGVSVSWGDTKLAAEPDQTTGAPTVTGLRLDEFSAVVAPSDPGARKRAVEAGYGDLLVDVPDATGVALADAHRRNAECAPCQPSTADVSADGARMVVKDHPECGEGKYALVSKDDESKVLGCFDSEAEAMAQEAAIAASEAAEKQSAKSMAARAVVADAPTLTAVRLSAALAPHRRAAPDAPLVRDYAQYLTDGTVSIPIGDGHEVLPPHAYRVVWTSVGVGFKSMRPPTDDLVPFVDSPVERVVREVDDFWAAKAKYQALGMMRHRGILMYGPPGTGKTSAGHQVAALMVARGDVVFYASDISDLARGLHAFREIEPARPVVVVLEDSDEHVHRSQQAFLNLLDGDNAVDDVLYLATTNYLDLFPQRLLRPGRFDRKVEVGPPPLAGRVAYLQQKLANVVPSVPAAEIARLAQATDGWSYGHLRELVVAAYALGEPIAEALARLAPARAVIDGHARASEMAPTSCRDAIELADGLERLHDGLRGLRADVAALAAPLQAIPDLVIAVRDAMKLAASAAGGRSGVERVEHAAAMVEQAAARIGGHAAQITSDDFEDIDTDIAASAFEAMHRQLAQMQETLDRASATLVPAVPSAH